MKTLLWAGLFLFAAADAVEKSCTARSCKGDECVERSCSLVKPSTKPPQRGKIVSCQECALRHHPKLRDWLRVKESYREWHSLEVHWHQGHHPILILISADGVEEQQIDLTQYDDGEKVEKMLRSKGFKMKGEVW